MKRIKTIIGRVISILLILFIVQSIATNGWLGGFGEMMKVALIFGVFNALYYLLKDEIASFFGILFIFFGSYLWFFYSGLIPGMIWQDIIPDAIGLGVCFFLVKWAFKKLSVEDRYGGGFIFMWILVSWFVISLVDWARPHALPVDPTRFTKEATHIQKWPESKQIGLALSGGGYRAVLFHAGVLSALEDIGIRVNTLSTVSGGSIIGAYYVLGGDPRDVPRLVNEGRFSLKRELMRFPNSPMVALPLTVPFSNVELIPAYDVNRLDVQTSLLRRLYGDNERSPDAPNLVINTSDVTYGFRVVFLEEGLLLQAPKDFPMYYSREHYKAKSALDLADQVSISGGFPGAFPPTEFELQINPPTATGDGFRTLSLVDGGVIDNLGLQSLELINSALQGHYGRGEVNESLRSDIFLVSDAGAIFSVEEEQTSASAAVRTFDVSYLHNTVADTEGKSEDLVKFSPKDHFLPPRLSFMLDDDDRVSEDIEQNQGYIKPRINLIRHSADIVKLMVGDLKKTQQVEAASLLADANKAFQIFYETDEPTQRVILQVQRYKDPDACARALGAQYSTLKPVCSLAQLQGLIEDIAKEYLVVFEQSSTLKDHYSLKDANALFQLGRIITFNRLFRLEKTLLGRPHPGASL